MGLLSGKANLSIFSVSGELPEYLEDKIKSFAFRDIDDTFEEYSVGWVSVVDKFDAGFTTESPLIGDYIAMSLRFDERRVSSAVINKFVDKEVRKVKEERQIPKVSRAQKTEIKTRVKTELVRKSKPFPYVFDLAWDVSRGIVFFFSTNKKAQGLLEMFFKDCFGMALCQKIPFTIGVDLLGEGKMNAVEPLTV